MRAQGRSRREIAAELHVGDDLLSELLQGTEVPPSLRRSRAKDEARALAREMYAEGRSYREIERELGVARSSLSLWLRDLKRTAPPVPAQSLPPPAPAIVLGDRRDVARELRTAGLLLKEIASELDVSTVTVHRWVRDLPVPRAARPGGSDEHMERMRRAYWDRVLLEREAERQHAKGAAAAAVGDISLRDLTLLAVVAYWCEGTKAKEWRRQERVTFINSDPDLIRLFLAWLRRMGVPDERLRVCLSIHESADVDAATRFWSDVTGIPSSGFSRPSLKRHNPKTVRKNVSESYVGCLVIRVLQSRVLYQYIEGTWQGIIQGAGIGDPATAA